MIETGITLEEDDRRDINLAIELTNTASFVLNNSQGLENLSEKQVKAIYEAACDSLIEGKLMLHSLRQDFSKKYNIPYNFISRDGDILLEENNNDC